MEIKYFILLITAYLIGSIPTAVWIGKTFFQTDVREHGSKNAGATNTFRVLGKKAGISVLLIDILKGLFAVIIVDIFLSEDDIYFIPIKLSCGIIAIIGHVFPLFAKFKGGKGVASSLGIIIGIFPIAALISFIIFSTVFLISKYVSLGAIITALSFPFIVIFLMRNINWYLIAFSIFLSLIVLITHHKNIRRLFEGNENKMNFFKK